MVDELHSQLVKKGRVVESLVGKVAQIVTKPIATEVRARFFDKGLKLPVRAVERAGDAVLVVEVRRDHLATTRTVTLPDEPPEGPVERQVVAQDGVFQIALAYKLVTQAAKA